MGRFFKSSCSDTNLSMDRVLALVWEGLNISKAKGPVQYPAGNSKQSPDFELIG